NPFKNLSALGVGFLTGNKLGIGKPKSARAPAMIVLRNILHDHFRRTVTHALSLYIWIQTERTVVRAASFALHADALADVFGKLRKHGREIWQIDRRRIQQRHPLLRTFGDASVFAQDVPL